MEISINLNKLFSKSRIDCINARKNENNLDFNFRSFKTLTLLNENLDLVLVLFYDSDWEYTYLVVYNSSCEIIVKEIILSKTKPCSACVFTNRKNRFVIELSNDRGFSKRLVLYNYELDLINSFKIEDSLIGADRNFIYTSQWKCKSNNVINLLDWSLNYETKIYIQNKDANKPFYFDTSSLMTVSCCPGHDKVANCGYFKKIKDKFILKNLTAICIYDRDGNLIIRKKLEKETFLTCSGTINTQIVMLDSKTSIVTESSDGNELFFYDSNGNYIKRSKCDITKLHNKYKYHHIEFTAKDDVIYLFLNSNPPEVLDNYCSILFNYLKSLTIYLSQINTV
jgi:hypothetical protein